MLLRQSCQKSKLSGKCPSSAIVRSCDPRLLRSRLRNESGKKLGGRPSPGLQLPFAAASAKCSAVKKIMSHCLDTSKSPRALCLIQGGVYRTGKALHSETLKHLENKTGCMLFPLLQLVGQHICEL